MGDLKEVHGVEGGIQPLITFIVGAGVEHPLSDALVIVPVQHFAKQQEIGLQGVAEGAQLVQELRRQAVGDIEAQTVDLEGIDPAADAVEQMLHDRGVLQVELDQLEMPLPALVPEAVVVVGIAIEIDVEPVLIGGVPFVPAHVLERPETAPDMVEHTVQHDTDAAFVQMAANGGEVIVGAEAAVDQAIVTRVVAVAVRLENGGEVDGIRTQLFDMGDPFVDPADASGKNTVIDARCTAEPERIDLIKNTFVCPHVMEVSFSVTKYRKAAGLLSKIWSLPCISISDFWLFVQSAVKKAEITGKIYTEIGKKTCGAHGTCDRIMQNNGHSAAYRRTVRLNVKIGHEYPV